MNLKNIFLSLLFIGSSLASLAGPTMPDLSNFNPDDFNPEELINAMLQDFSPEEREAILNEAQRIEDHLGSLSPEEREMAERQMMEDANKLFQNAMQQEQAIAEPKIQPTKETKKAPEKPKKEVAQSKDINSIEGALDSLFNALGSLSLKVQSLPRVSTKTAFEQAWPSKEAELVYAKALFKTSRNSKQVLKSLANEENKTLSDNLKDFSKNLKSQEAKLKVPDTAKLKKSWGEKKEVACCSDDIKKAQDNLEKIIETINQYFGKGILKNLRELVQKISPEDLKRQETRTAAPQSVTNFQPSYYANYPSVPFGQGSNQATSQAAIDQLDFPYYDPVFYDDVYLDALRGAQEASLHASTKDSVDKDVEDGAKKLDNPLDEAKVEAKKPSAPIKTNSGNVAKQEFTKKLANLDKMIDEVGLVEKVTLLPKAKGDNLDELQKDILLPLLEIQPELSAIKKHAVKVIDKAKGSQNIDSAKEQLNKLYTESKLGKFIEDLKNKPIEEAYSPDFIDTVKSIQKKHASLKTILNKDKEKQEIIKEN